MQENHIELTGYLASKPEARPLPSGTLVANARIGQSYLYDTKEGTKRRHTNWFTLAFYGELARTAVQFEQGDHLNVNGSMQQREFTPKDGSTRKVYELVVKQCRRLGRPRSNSQVADSPSTEESLVHSETSEVSATAQEEIDAWAIL